MAGRRRQLTVIAAVIGTVSALGGLALAAGLTLNSPHLGAAQVTTPVFFPTTLSTTNGGKTTGKLEKNDTLTVDYSREVQASTLCAGVGNVIGTQTLTGVTVTVANNASGTGTDVLNVSTTSCGGTLHFGSVDLGAAGYVTTASTFTGSSVALTQTATSSSVKITLGTLSGSVGTVNSGTPGVYTPDSGLADVNGNAIGNNLAKSTATVLF